MKGLLACGVITKTCRTILIIDNQNGQDKTNNDQNTIKPAKTETQCSVLKT